ncbi:MAG: class I SAM-dependent methyltransferase [Kiritimatiellae bacterium]|nr:class I SAM-dependent methyltransferase [Kiritimatiellia bacterium]
MKQNIYDDPQFFAGYSSMRKTGGGLNEVLEQPAMVSLLPEVIHGTVLDLGCGDGGLCVRLLDLGANSVIGVDLSQNMIRAARERCAGRKDIQFHCLAIEDFQSPDGAFDLVVSSLAFHYIPNLEALFHNIQAWLKDGGMLVFSIEHPVATCSQGIHAGWYRDANNKKCHWQVDCYADEGERRSRWFVDGVIKYHRTVSSIVNHLVGAGFHIVRMLEPHATEKAEQEKPSLLEERRRPPFLLMKALKAKHGKTEPDFAPYR